MVHTRNIVACIKGLSFIHFFMSAVLSDKLAQEGRFENKSYGFITSKRRIFELGLNFNDI